jgi:hypothetical protein
MTGVWIKKGSKVRLGGIPLSGPSAGGNALRFFGSDTLWNKKLPDNAEIVADPLPGLYDLVAASVGVIDWSAPTSMAALRQLRDSPWREQAEDDAETPASVVLRQALDRVA